MKKILLSLIATSVMMSANVNAKTLNLGHAMSLDNAAHKGMVIFADKVKEKSNGDLNVRIFPNAQLGSERDQAEQVVTGALDMAKINGSLAESFEPTFKTVSIPFLFDSIEHKRQFMRSDTAEKMLLSSEGKGFIGLTFYDSGTRSFYGSKPFKTPDDLAGLKVRVPESPTMMEMINLLGARATPMPFTEIYTGLQQGVIDAAENNVSSLVEMRHTEVANYYSVDQHTMSPDLIIISESTWASLKPDQQKIIKEAAAESLEEQIKLWDKIENANVEKAKSIGVTFVEVDKDKFREKVRPMLDSALEDPSLSYYVEKIQTM
ncbi:TRAP transporter substrate-binding protein [Photobacterium sp. DNB23_23_1]|uniref:TRAP transporter substrate-binding protein n=1 Tax=Photobacterium pectinilyticum TaxID=2906793 RepID=A0ABT1N8H0_9GAMM|nr:TRAP transporter substrate-binding protein [Photobacterium sp. ZSDE20]MCQ1061026.1 TRAP transporter substrate-binding protein [Photobacterium sp. ZSDE20]MDD1829030.1 TRAP transporter substrate-binding protein [Photobacterium sp. ZSDE20]